MRSLRGKSPWEVFFEQPRHINPDKVFFLYKEKIAEILENFEKLAVARMRTVPHVLCLEKIARSIAVGGDARVSLMEGLHALYGEEKDFSTAHIFDDLLERYAVLRDQYQRRVESKRRGIDRVDDISWFRNEVKDLFSTIPSDKIEAVNTLALKVFYDHFLQEDEGREKQKKSPQNPKEIFELKKQWERTFLAMSFEQRSHFLDDLEKTFIYFGSGSEMPTPLQVARALTSCRRPRCEEIPDDLFRAIICNADQKGVQRLLKKGQESISSVIDPFCLKKLKEFYSTYSPQSIIDAVSNVSKEILTSAFAHVSNEIFSQAKQQLIGVMTGDRLSYDVMNRDFISACNAILQYIVYDVSHEAVFQVKEVVARKPVVAGQRPGAIPSEAELQKIERERTLERLSRLGDKLGAEKINADDIELVKKVIKGLKKDRRFYEFSSKDWELVEDIFCAQKLSSEHGIFIDKNLKLLREIYDYVEPSYSLGKSGGIPEHFSHPNGWRKPSKGTSDQQFARSGGRGWPLKGRSSAGYDVED